MNKAEEKELLNSILKRKEIKPKCLNCFLECVTEKEMGNCPNQPKNKSE